MLGQARSVVAGRGARRTGAGGSIRVRRGRLSAASGGRQEDRPDELRPGCAGGSQWRLDHAGGGQRRPMSGGRLGRGGNRWRRLGWPGQPRVAASGGSHAGRGRRPSGDRGSCGRRQGRDRVWI
jgi:hypothetical protein